MQQLNMIVKYTATYSDGSVADFLSLEDLIAHDGAPELHPDVGVTQNPVPKEDAVTATPEPVAASVESEVPVEPAPEV